MDKNIIKALASELAKNIKNEKDPSEKREIISALRSKRTYCLLVWLTEDQKRKLTVRNQSNQYNISQLMVSPVGHGALTQGADLTGSGRVAFNAVLISKAQNGSIFLA